MPEIYSPEDYDHILENNNKILVELNEIENQGWDKKKDRIKRYVDNSRILLGAGKLPLENKKQFASYIFQKITEYTTISRNGDFYSLFKEDETKDEMSRIVDEKATKISSASGKTVDEQFRDKILSKPKKETAYTKYIENENKTLDDAKSLNSALLEKYNESDELAKIMDKNFNEKMISDLIAIHSTINLAREYVDDRNKLSNYQKLNLQLLINLGQTKAQAARDVNYCSKYASIGIERSEDLTKLWDFLGECHVCHSDIKETRDKAIRDYESGKELDFDIPVKGY